MRTEREPNRYDPLNETHRRVAEEEEKRRLAGQDQARSAPAQTEPEPERPGTELRPQRPEVAPDHDPNSPEARLAAKEQELQEQVRLGRIKPSEMIYQLRRLDNHLSIERAEAGTPPSTPRRDGGGPDEMATEPERAEPQVPERADDAPEPTIARTRQDSGQPVPSTRIAREAEAAEYETNGRGEMNDARIRRMARLWGIDRTIERENRENEGESPNLDHDPGDRSR